MFLPKTIFQAMALLMPQLFLRKPAFIFFIGESLSVRSERGTHVRGLIRWLMMAAIAVSLVLSSLPGNWAQAADGDGDGSGGGQNNPLVIESSTPANGAAGVATLEYIKVVFSKNVVYMTVRDQNMQCFSLWSGSQRIPAEIIMADDQIEREKRRDVLIKPKQPLQPGTFLVL